MVHLLPHSDRDNVARMFWDLGIVREGDFILSSGARSRI